MRGFSRDRMDLSRHRALYRRMKAKVAETMPERASELDTVLSAYDGDVTILRNFLLKFGSDNPWEAAQNASLRQAIFRTKKKASREILGISESGHKLTEQMFILTHKYDPTRAWHSGSQAILKIMEAFGTPQQKEGYTSEGKRKLAEKKKGQARDTLHDFADSLEEVLRDPSRLAHVQSRNERLEVQKILEVDALRHRIQQLDALLYGNSAFVDEHHPSYLLAMDPGGTLFGWFKRKMKELPTAIRDIYTTVTSPIVEIAETDRKFMFGSLLAYAAANMPLRREAVLGGYQEDLEFVLKLNEHDPLIQKYGKPNLAPVRNILRQNEITLIDATRVFDAYPIDQVRREINKQCYEQYQAEVKNVLNILTPLFIHEGRWFEDSLGTSVPWKRLRESVYSLCLQREDFIPVTDLLRLQTLAPTEEKFYQALSLPQFRQKIKAVVIAGRKVKVLGELQRESAGEAVERGERTEEIKRTNGRIIRGQEYRLAEDFLETQGVSLNEFIERVEYVNRKRRVIWGKLKDKMLAEAGYGLYSTTDLESLEPVMEEAKALISYAAVKESVDQADTLFQHPLVKRFDKYHLLPNEAHRWTTPEKAAFLQELLTTVGNKLRAEEEKYGDKLEPILERREKWIRSRLYNALPSAQKLSITRTILEYDEPRTYLDCGITILDVGSLEQALGRFEQEYIAVNSLPADWKKQANYVVSRSAESLLRNIGKGISDTATWKAVKEMRPEHYVHQQLRQEVEEMYEQMKHCLTYVPGSISEGREIFEAAELYDSFKVEIGGEIKLSRQFRDNFGQELYLTQDKRWVSRRQLDKRVIAELTKRIDGYNWEHELGLSLRVFKAQE